MKRSKFEFYKFIFIGIIIFFILHLDSLGLFGIDVLSFLQIILFLFFTLGILKNYSFLKRRLKLTFVLGLAASLSAILNLYTFENIKDDLSFFVATATLPIALPYFASVLEKKETYFAKNRMIIFTSFCILSALPYLLGILPQREGADDILWKYGLEEGREVFIGFYGGVANSSKVITVALLIACAVLFKVKRNLPLLLLVALGSYALIYTFARTGWYSFIGGLFLVYAGGRSFSELFKKVLPVLIVFILGIGYFLSTNEFVARRLVDEKIYNTSSRSGILESLSESRGTIQGASVEIVANMSASELFFGIGITEIKNRMKRYHGSEIVPHNKFLMILIGGGLKMMFLYILYLYFLFKYLKTYASLNNKDYLLKLPMALFAVFIVTQIPSHGFEFFSSMLFALAIAQAVSIRMYESRKAEGTIA